MKEAEFCRNAIAEMRKRNRDTLYLNPKTGNTSERSAKADGLSRDGYATDASERGTRASRDSRPAVTRLTAGSLEQRLGAASLCIKTTASRLQKLKVRELTLSRSLIQRREALDQVIAHKERLDLVEQNAELLDVMRSVNQVMISCTEGQDVRQVRGLVEDQERLAIESERVRDLINTGVAESPYSEPIDEHSLDAMMREYGIACIMDPNRLVAGADEPAHYDALPPHDLTASNDAAPYLPPCASYTVTNPSVAPSPAPNHRDRVAFDLIK
jgi:hypothetical protein